MIIKNKGKHFVRNSLKLKVQHIIEMDVTQLRPILSGSLNFLRTVSRFYDPLAISLH